VLARVVGLETRERAAVTSQLGQRQAGLEIAEQRGELPPLQLHEQLARGRRFEALLGRVAIERVEAIRLDGAEQLVLRHFVIARGIVRGSQQVLALDRALGEERDAAFGRVALFQAGIGRRLHVVADRAVGRSVLGETDEDPVARLRLQPHTDLLLPALAETQPEDGSARLRRRLQLQAREAVGIDGERRRARADGDQLVVVAGFDFEPRAIRCLRAERALRARTRRLTRRIDHADRDHGVRAAIGHEGRSFANDLGAHRAVRVVDGARQALQLVAFGIANDGDQLVVALAQIDAAPLADAHGVRLVGLDAVEVERADHCTVHLQLDRLRRRMLEHDAQARDRRNFVCGRQEPCGARLQLLDVELARSDVGLGSSGRGAGGGRQTKRSDRLGLRVRRCGLHGEAAGSDDAQTFDGDVDAAIEREACAIVTRRERLIGAVALDRHTRRIDAQALLQVLRDDFGTRTRQRVVVGVDGPIARSDQ
jgi:hypothetical protein